MNIGKMHLKICWKRHVLNHQKVDDEIWYLPLCPWTLECTSTTAKKLDPYFIHTTLQCFKISTKTMNMA